MNNAYLSLGTNLGNRPDNLSQAIELLNAAAVRVIRKSSVYETAPRDYLHQPAFLNMVVECETELSPLDLVRACLQIEAAMGRQRLVPKGPRLIDIDVLLFGDVVMQTEELELPHPRMLQRRFVLEPLLELDPDIKDPASGKRVREFLDAVKQQAVTRLQP